MEHMMGEHKINLDLDKTLCFSHFILTHGLEYAVWSGFLLKSGFVLTPPCDLEFAFGLHEVQPGGH